MESIERGFGMVHWEKPKFTQVMAQNYKKKILGLLMALKKQKFFL